MALCTTVFFKMKRITSHALEVASLELFVNLVPAGIVQDILEDILGYKAQDIPSYTANNLRPKMYDNDAYYRHASMFITKNIPAVVLRFVRRTMRSLQALGKVSLI